MDKTLIPEWTAVERTEVDALGALYRAISDYAYYSYLHEDCLDKALRVYTMLDAYREAVENRAQTNKGVD